VGSATQPFRTAQKLVDSLRSGETGCLRAGSYAGGMTFRTPGTATAPITVTSYPGEKATVAGLVWVSKTAPFVNVERLYLDGTASSQPSPQVNASDVRFASNDVTNNHTNICFLVGDSNGVYGRADRAVIESNRVHDCGVLPATNHQHGIYLEAATGARIEGNWFYDNADWGVHLYPDADHTVIRGNVIDGNGKGLIVAGTNGQSSDDNLVERNLITNSTIRFNVDAWWPDDSSMPQRNLVSKNCLKAGARDDYHNGGIEPSAAYTLDSNLATNDPGYVNAAANDFRLTATSPCRALFAGNPDTIPGPDGLPKAGRRVRVTLSARKRLVRRGERVRLRGRVRGARVARGTRVAIISSGGRRRVIARGHVRRNGRFSVRPRIRAGCRVVRLRAVVHGVGRSRALRLRLRG
jgi:parallel beta-helix repeat protein